jgi:hypothetical protein
VSRDYLDSLVRKLVADGANRQSIVRTLEHSLIEARRKGGDGSGHCERITRVLFYLQTRLVPRHTNNADMSILRFLQHLR